MSLNSKKTWMDGKWVDSNQATVPLMTHTLHYGYGAFEGKFVHI